MASPFTLEDFHARLGSVPLYRVWMNPPPGTATEADLLTAWTTPPHHRPELVDGALVEKFGSFAGALVAGHLARHVGNYAHAHDSGACFAGNLPYRLRADLIRVPTFSYVPWERFPNCEVPDDQIASIPPALAVEVANETNTSAELDRKAREYALAGCQLVWLIDPQSKTAKVYTSAKRFKELDAAGTLDGGKVLPGFKLALADLFTATKPRKKKSK